MRRKLLEKLCCPFDKSDLKLVVITEEDGEIYEGLLICPECNRYYPIIYGLPIMSPDEYRQKALEAPVLERWGLNVSAEANVFRLEQGESARLLES